MFSSCEKDEIIGPNYTQVKNADINITQSLSSSGSSKNFTNKETVTFTAELEFDKEWIITITGDNSSATRTYNGIGSDISITWDGSTGGTLPLFIAEPITVTLSFPDNATITETISFTSTGARNIDEGGVLVSDFTSAPVVTWGNPGWESDFPLTTNANTDYTQPDNTPYFYQVGAPWQPASPYVDITYIPSLYTDLATPLYPLYADPARIYFNVMVYGDPASSDTWAILQMVEKSGVEFTYDLRPNWTGWKLLSIPYTDFVGAGTPNPTQLEKIGVVLLSDATLPSSQNVSIALDHMIFTFDKPLKL